VQGGRRDSPDDADHAERTVSTYSAELVPMRPDKRDEGITFTLSFPAASSSEARLLLNRVFPFFMLTSEPTLRSER
jgi:hypothetical protein